MSKINAKKAARQANDVMVNGPESLQVGHRSSYLKLAPVKLGTFTTFMSV